MAMICYSMSFCLAAPYPTNFNYYILYSVNDNWTIVIIIIFCLYTTSISTVKSGLCSIPTGSIPYQLVAYKVMEISFWKIVLYSFHSAPCNKDSSEFVCTLNMLREIACLPVSTDDANGLSPFFFSLFNTPIGNVFVIAAILLERHLHSVANYLIVSLAVADLLVACLVMPLGAVYEVKIQ